MKVKSLRDEYGKIDKRYAIAENGSYIREKRTEKKLKIYVSQGYRVISIKINGKSYSRIKICHLQWLAWKGIIPKGSVIHHIDENKLNDHKDSLACMTKSEHMKYHGKERTGEKHPMWGKHHTEEWKKKNRESNIGLHAGEKNPNVKITDNQVEKIKFLGYIKHLMQKDIAKKIGTSKSNVNHILQGHSRNPNHLSKEELIQQTKRRLKKSLRS
jgi:predicted XRE-type DNA-binding protein